MTVELTQHNDELTVFPPARPMQSTAITQLREHAEAMDTAFKLADAMCNTTLVPAIYRGKPQDGTAAILYGAELGLNPIQSLQNIFPVHGMPSLYARTMVALIKRHGYKVQTLESTDEKVTVWGQAPDGTEETSTWTIERAAQAGYVPTIDENTGRFKTNANGKLIGNEKYLKDPRAMLYAKAAAEVCRHIAPDVLLGIAYSYEDLEGDDVSDAPRPVRNETASRTVNADELRARLGIGASPVADAPAEPEPAPTPVAEPEPTPESEQSEPAAESAEQTFESASAKPTTAQNNRLNVLFVAGGLPKSAKDKRRLVTEEFLDRADFTETPMTADEADKMIAALEKIDNEGPDVLKDAITALVAELEGETAK